MSSTSTALTSPEKLSVQLVLNLQVYLRALRTYQSNNAMVTRAREQVQASLQGYFKLQPQPINLQFLEGETFVNGTLLTVDFQSFLRAQELTRLLRGYDVGEITIELLAKKPIPDRTASARSRTGTASVPPVIEPWGSPACSSWLRNLVMRLPSQRW